MKQSILYGIIALLAVATTPIYAQQQQQQPPSSPTAQKILDDARAYCEQITEEPGSSCVSVAHQSPTLMVLGGKLLLVPFVGASTPYDNIFIWQAVDGFKAQGYSIDAVQLTGQGTESNPHNLMIVMSK